VLTKLQKLSYGIARLGSTTLLSAFSFAGFYVYWDVYKLDPQLSGVVSAIGKLAILINSVIMGYLSDATRSRLGKRKPYIITGSPLLAISAVMYFVPFLFISIEDKSALFYWGAFWNAAFNFFYGYLLTPYQAWMPEITEPEERITITTLQNVSNILGNVVGVVFSFLVPTLYRGGLLLPVMAAFAVMEVLLYMPSVLLIPVESKAVLTPKITRDILDLLKYREFMLWEGVRMLMSAAETMITALVVKYVSSVVGLGGDLASVVFGVVMVVFVMGAFPFWGKQARKIGKGPALIRAAVILTAGLLLAPLPAFLQDQALKIAVGLLAIALGAVGISAYELFPYAVVADLAHWDELRTGLSRAGLFTGFEGIPINISQSLTYLLVGYLASLPPFNGYDYTLGLVVWGPIASVFAVLSILILRRVNIDPFKK